MVNETAVLLYGQLLTGRKYVPQADGLVELQKQWAKQVLPFPYQTVVKVNAPCQHAEENMHVLWFMVMTRWDMNIDGILLS